ncbi:RNA ligase [Staphylococcus phage CF1]|nr:RNA ligase [Staphylococcus phage CF1]
MKQLVLMRGAPGAGKSTFIKENGLEPYTISPDKLRQMHTSPVYNEQGIKVISQKHDNQVWDNLMETLEERMINGDFTVIDATHSTGKLIKKYETLARKYRYRTYVVTIKQDLDTLIERNNQREELKKVPEDVVYNIYERLQHEHIPSYATEIKPNELMNEIKWDKDFLDTDSYDKIHVIGDIHSCFTAINQFASYQKIIDNPNELFIFVGDYFDRGLETKEMFDYLELIYKQPNVVLLEGNHEKHLRRYAFLDEDKYISLNNALDNSNTTDETFFDTAIELFHARGFIPTLKEFLNYGISQKRVRRIVHSLQQMLYFNYKGQYYMINHGGILPNMLDDINLVSTHQIINGVGGYEYQIDEQWDGSDTIQIHGHRNLYREPLDVTKQSINLEGRVEKGGFLRTVTINSDNTLTPHEIKNEVFNSKFLLNNDYTKDIDPNLTVEEYLRLAKEDKYIKVIPQYDNVVSVNFTKRAFKRKHWNQLSVTARGLFIDESTNEIVGRGYNKFFNINERPETNLENLPDTLKFPVTASLKYNGFLGLMFYDSNRDELIYASKSRTHLSQYDNDFALLFKEIVEETWTNEQIESAKEYLKDMNRTLLFEVIDNINDPHIIYEAGKRRVVLLDAIDNTLKFNKLFNEALVYVAANIIGIYKNISTPHFSFSNWNDLFNFYKDLERDSSIAIEGFVFEDSNGFMLKYKTPYYNNWKYMRSLVESLSKGNLQRRPIQAIFQKDKTLTNFYYWAKQQDKEYLEKDIITLRNDYYKETQD